MQRTCRQREEQVQRPNGRKGYRFQEQKEEAEAWWVSGRLVWNEDVKVGRGHHHHLIYIVRSFAFMDFPAIWPSFIHLYTIHLQTESNNLISPMLEFLCCYTAYQLHDWPTYCTMAEVAYNISLYSCLGNTSFHSNYSLSLTTYSLLVSGASL